MENTLKVCPTPVSSVTKLSGLETLHVDILELVIITYNETVDSSVRQSDKMPAVT